MATVKDRVKQLCKIHGISVFQLEENAKIKHGVISKWDRYMPNASNLAAVAVYFNVPIEALTGDLPLEDYILPEPKSRTTVDNTEIELLELFHQLNTRNRYRAIVYLDDLLKAQREDEKEDAALLTSKVG